MNNCTNGWFHKISTEQAIKDFEAYMPEALGTILILSEDNGVSLSSLKEIPIRLVYKKNRCIAIGHFMKDRFVYIDDLMSYTGWINNEK